MSIFGIPSSIVDGQLNKNEDPNKRYQELISECTRLVKATAVLIDIQQNPRIHGSQIIAAVQEFKTAACHVVFYLAMFFVILQFTDGDMMQGIYMFLADKNQGETNIEKSP